MLAACEGGEGGGLFGGGNGANPFAQNQEAPENASPQATAQRSGRVIEQDVEAPDVFQVSDSGLWDGRPSLGGVWVAHSDVADPQRVIIRTADGSKSVVGALFRREVDNPGPPIQVSSEAARALGMLAGQPSQLNVVALVREEIEEVSEVPAPDAAVALDAPDAIEETSLDPIEAASAAIDGEEEPPAITPNTGAETTAPAPAAPAAAAPAASTLDKPYIQIGIFSIEANANDTATSVRQNGMSARVLEHTLGDKNFWRVVVGPAPTAADRASLLEQIKTLGFADAYFVSN